MIVRNEASRYLEENMRHLTEFCDGIRVLDDHSDDESAAICVKAGARVRQTDGPEFFEHEGRTRQKLLEWTLDANPTHVLAIDADEFIADGKAVRDACERSGAVWTLDMEEVWELDGSCLCVREDGGWLTHPVPVLYAVPAARDYTWAIRDAALACGREPMAVRQSSSTAARAGTEIMHFGWANEQERRARYDRYAAHDGGRYHAGSHLDSILWGPEAVTLRGRTWPDALAPLRTAITQRVRSAS